MLRFTRGLSLTLLGFASKAYFLLLIAPGMDSGEFARYFLAASVAVIAGRILGLGSRDDLVFRIKHNLGRTSYYLRGTAIYYLGAWLVLLLAGATGYGSNIEMAAMAYALVIAGNNFLTGTLRSYSNAFQELNANAPWLVICLLSIILNVRHAEDVLYLLVAGHSALYLINILVAYHLGVAICRPSPMVLMTQFKRYKAWLPKSVSSMALAANLRSYPIWLSSLGYILTDSLAYAFVIGEVIFQLCMVYVNQVHSSLKLQEGLVETRKVLRVGVVMLVLAAIVPVPVYYVLTSGLLVKAIFVPFETLLYTSVYCGTLAFFSLVRIGAWRQESFSASISVLLMQLLFFIVVGILVSIMGYNVFLLFIATMINVVSISIYLKSRFHSKAGT